MEGITVDEKLCAGLTFQRHEGLDDVAESPTWDEGYARARWQQACANVLAGY
jgi:hypothetical protein